jgi:2-oxoglutarate dehydrogenase E1 component
MYAAIDARPPIRSLYASILAARGDDLSAAEKAAGEMQAALHSAFAAAKSWKVNKADCFEGRWSGLGPADEASLLAGVPTGLSHARLLELGRAITSLPEGFSPDPKVARFLDERRRSIETGQGLTWPTAEALALASLLGEGTSVRLGGQDTVRGAFTQRHLEVHDRETGARHLTLSPAARAFATAEIHNTPLIEHAVLAFEYGLSLADPSRLIVWEAQFGDFLNYAQPVFDQCIACGDDRWLRSSGLVILLPHGIDGGGPDHSTGRPERLLAACAGPNLQIVNASTPANFFHALRRQMHRPFRTPLVVLTPKALLRHKACVSRIDDIAAGTGFRHVIDDADVGTATRVILCTGKVSYELAAERAARNVLDRVAIIRVEQLHPLPADEIRRAIERHAPSDVVWCEEEPENMGYLTHLDRRLEAIAGRRVRRIGRPAVATPAVGVKYWHEAEIRAILDEVFAGIV